MKKGSSEVNEKMVERLPFTVKLVLQSEDWDAAIKVRQKAYARHLPALAEKLGEREEMDLLPDTDVLVAFSRLDTEPLGTMRVHLGGSRPLPLEQSVKLPSYFKSAKLIEASRFALPAGSYGSVLTTAFFKAFYLYAEHHEADYMVITARRPVDRMYERLMFKDVDPQAGYIPMKHVGNVPHRVLFLPVKTLEAVWRAAAHPLCQYFFETEHPDLDAVRNAAVAVEEYE
jgi:hypothetical protein